MFDFDKQLPPSSIEKEQLLLQVSRHSLITSLNQEVPCIVHVHVLLYPMWKVTKEFLKKTQNAKLKFLMKFSLV